MQVPLKGPFEAEIQSSEERALTWLVVWYGEGVKGQVDAAGSGNFGKTEN